jgi:multicomponent K+:H+ antiporter subunit G
MSAPELPLWLAIVVSLLVVAGAGLALLGSLGLLRLRTFYERVHAPTLAGTLGATAILLASMLLASFDAGRPIVHELVLGAVLFTTTPVALLLLVRAALYRDRHEGNMAVAPPTEATDTPGTAPADGAARDAQ